MRYLDKEDRISKEKEDELNKIFNRRMWHSYACLDRKDGQKLCYWCDAPETSRAFVNIWGTVHEVGACQTCYEKNNGKLRDAL